MRISDWSSDVCSSDLVFGIKPTRARTPMGPDRSEGWGGMSIAHVVSRSVRDSAAMLDATHGPAEGDPYAAPAFTGPFLAAASTAQIGRASCRERVCQAVEISVCSVPLKKKKPT